MGLSNDLRERVVEAVVLGGLSRNQAAAHFKVSIASAVRWVKRFQTTGQGNRLKIRVTNGRRAEFVVIL